MKRVTAALIGAGARGMDAYGRYALEHPHDIAFVAVAEPDPERREKFKNLHGISDDMCFESWKQLLEQPRLADAALVCTQDRMHFQPALEALEKGYHLLLEKPMSIDPLECIAVGEAAGKSGKTALVCHVLRYTPFFRSIKELLDDGRIGRLISIQHNENVGYYHQAHSYVRGNWRNSDVSSPMILAKSCHDMDILLWLAGSECTRISSFGSLTHFRSENAPDGAPDRCLDGCPAEAACPYYAPRLYLTPSTDWPASVISVDTSLEARERALREGPYGRCVYKCDNNVVDHQVASIEFANEVTAVFTMCAFTPEISRTLKLMGTRGEIRGSMEKNEIEVTDFNSGRREIINLNGGASGHGGGDAALMGDFARLVREGGGGSGFTSATHSVLSHLMAFAAEKSRLSGKTVDMEDYINGLKKTVRGV